MTKWSLNIILTTKKRKLIWKAKGNFHEHTYTNILFLIRYLRHIYLSEKT